jgi:hypothetical protein
MDKLFRGTGGICQIAKDKEFPNVFTSALCRSSGGAWSGGHDLVCIPLLDLSNQSRVDISLYLPMLLYSYGGNYCRISRCQNSCQRQEQR